MPAADPPALFIEQRGANLMIRLRGDHDTQEYSMFSAIPSLPGHTVILTSVGALTSRDLSQAVNQAAHQAFATMSGPVPPGHRLWLAMSGLGRLDTTIRPLPQRLAEEFGVEVLASQGALSLVPGGLLFAGGASGDMWRRFRRGDTSRPWGARHPQPEWEAQLPPDPVTSVHRLTVEPVPAGLLILAEDATPTSPLDVTYAVAVHPERPRLILGRPGERAVSPAEVAALVAMFPPMLGAALELVPHTPEVATAEWSFELARQLNREVRVSTGLPLYGHDGRVHVIAYDAHGRQLLRHPATTLRYSPDGTAAVLECQAPPAGWINAGRTFHRLPSAALPTPADPVAEVVPSGFALVPAASVGGPHSAAARPLDPRRLVVTVGFTGAKLPAWAPGTLAKLLAGLGPDARARLRVLAFGQLTADEKQTLFDVINSVEFGDTEEDPSERETEPAIVPVPDTGHPVPPARHRSTRTEQVEFQRLAGELFTTSADLRGYAVVKADLIAVSLYLGDGEFGALAVNAALRAGNPVPRAYLGCLTSGLRQLPVHRGVVFRQGTLAEIGSRYTEGDVVSEPGFLSATAAENLTVPSAPVDLLIWSRSGRGTDGLSRNGLPQEVVFAARTRLKVLAVFDDDRRAVLFRELHPDEFPASRSLDSTDIAVLSKLDRSLWRRRGTRLRRLEDFDQIGRLATDA
ncbi:MAG: hypothetical protein QOI21_5994 [Actinomycetota bacterium]|nr:hypothetical protein [Actinomycetota bacterium]